MPACWLKANWPWEDPLPRVEEVVLYVAGQTYADYLIEQVRRQGYLRKP